MKKKGWLSAVTLLETTRARAGGVGDLNKALPARVRGARKLVVVGNGMVGYRFCEKFMESPGRESFQMTVFGEEPREAYDRIHLTDIFSGREEQSLTLATREWYREHDIQLHTGDPVVAIDRERRWVRSARGREASYDLLVLATGSRPFVPSIPGTELSKVHVYRTLEDLRSIRGEVPCSRRAAVIGGGLLGLEAAKALNDAGLETHVIEHGTGLMARQLGPEGSRLLQEQIERLGLRVRTCTEVCRIEAVGLERLLMFAEGEPLGVDLVVLAAGIRPRDELARECGLQTGLRGGVVVNDQLQTSDPHIYALGECASHRGVVYGLVAPGYKMANVLAANLAGGMEKFRGDDLSASLKLMGVAVATLGNFQGNGSTVKTKGPNHYRELVMWEGRIIGATGVGDWPEMRRVQEAIESKRRVWPWQVGRFRKRGRVWPEAETVHVSQWPASAVVCHCMRVTRGTLTRAMAQPETRCLRALMRSTGASTVCGSCRPLLADLLGEEAIQPSRGWRGLLAASGMALAGILLFVGMPDWPMSDSVQGGWQWDRLWRSGKLKQATGYTLLGLMVLSLGLSMRKRLRWSWLSRSDFAWWRLAHAVLGAVSLIALVTHTGFRLGHHLNLVLMLNFAALAAMGGLAGFMAALDAKWRGPRARRWREWWTATHMVLFWPMPALLFFHIFKGYYY